MFHPDTVALRCSKYVCRSGTLNILLTLQHHQITISRHLFCLFVSPVRDIDLLIISLTILHIQTDAHIIYTQLEHKGVLLILHTPAYYIKMRRWRNGYAPACRAGHPGSNPGLRFLFKISRDNKIIWGFILPP